MYWNRNSRFPNWVELQHFIFCILMRYFNPPNLINQQQRKRPWRNRLEFKLEQGFSSSWVALNKSVDFFESQFDQDNCVNEEGDDNNNLKRSICYWPFCAKHCPVTCYTAWHLSTMFPHHAYQLSSIHGFWILSRHGPVLSHCNPAMSYFHSVLYNSQ